MLLPQRGSDLTNADSCAQLPRIAAELEEYQAGREAPPEPAVGGKAEVGREAGVGSGAGVWLL